MKAEYGTRRQSPIVDATSAERSAWGSETTRRNQAVVDELQQAYSAAITLLGHDAPLCSILRHAIRRFGDLGADVNL
jgi:hypothetical protein